MYFVNLAEAAEAVEDVLRQVENRAGVLADVCEQGSKLPTGVVVAASKELVAVSNQRTVFQGILEAIRDADDAQRRLERRCLASQCHELHWRVLCMQFALGDIDAQGLFDAAFKELIGAALNEARLRQQLDALVARYEQMKEIEVAENRPLRSIQLT